MANATLIGAIVLILCLALAVLLVAEERTTVRETCCEECISASLADPLPVVALEPCRKYAALVGANGVAALTEGCDEFFEERPYTVEQCRTVAVEN